MCHHLIDPLLLKPIGVTDSFSHHFYFSWLSYIFTIKRVGYTQAVSDRIAQETLVNPGKVFKRDDLWGTSVITPVLPINFCWYLRDSDAVNGHTKPDEHVELKRTTHNRVSTHFQSLENTKSVEHMTNKVHHLLSTEGAAQHEDGWSVACNLVFADDEMVGIRMDFREQGMRADEKRFHNFPFKHVFRTLNKLK